MSNWTDANDQALIAFRENGLSMKKIADRLGFTVRELDNRVRQLKLTSKRRRWTASEDDILVQMRLAGANADEIGVRLNRVAGAIQARITTHGTILGIPLHVHLWTPKEDAQLRKMRASGAEVDAIAHKIGRTGTSVTARVIRLDLARRSTGRTWTADEHKLLEREYHAGKTISEIAGSLNRTVQATKSRVSKLRIHR